MTGAPEQFWVFGYGSLMWRPGFDYLHSCPAELSGFHRSLCVYSWVHRGTQQNPGLVFGLDHGGSCKGMAFSVAPENWNATVKYLREREQVTAVYLESTQNIILGDNQQSPAKALTYLVDRDHKQYAGQLSFKEQIKFAKQGTGQSGKCRDYVVAAANQLEDLGVQDDEIQALAKTLSPG